MKKIVTLSLSIISTFFIMSGCAATNTAGGAALGATAGAVAGAMVGNHRDAIIGAAGGAVAGALIGKELDDQERETKLRNYQ